MSDSTLNSNHFRRWLALLALSYPVALAAGTRADAPGHDIAADAAAGPLVVRELNARDLEVPVLEARILASRRAIETGEFEVQPELSKRGDRPEARSYHVWVASGGRIREERDVGRDHQVVILDSEFAYSYSSRPGELDNPDRTRRSAITRLPLAEARRERRWFQAHDPRLVMMVPVQFGLTAYHDLADLVGAEGRDGLSAQASVWHGEPSVVVSFSTPKTGNRYEYEAVPSRSYNIVRWRMRGSLPAEGGKEVPFEHVATCELQRVAPGVWFPESVELHGTLDGPVERSERLTIKVVQVNGPVADKVFTLANGDVPAGVAIRQGLVFGKDAARREPVDMPRPLIWDGEQVRPVTEEDYKAIEASRGRR